ncbi:MAG: hypothetical protein V9E86_08365 [Nitrosomonas sp.]
MHVALILSSSTQQSYEPDPIELPSTSFKAGPPMQDSLVATNKDIAGIQLKSDDPITISQ